MEDVVADKNDDSDLAHFDRDHAGQRRRFTMTFHCRCGRYTTMGSGQLGGLGLAGRALWAVGPGDQVGRFSVPVRQRPPLMKTRFLRGRSVPSSSTRAHAISRCNEQYVGHDSCLQISVLDDVRTRNNDGTKLTCAQRANHTTTSWEAAARRSSSDARWIVRDYYRQSGG